MSTLEFAIIAASAAIVTLASAALVALHRWLSSTYSGEALAILARAADAVSTAVYEVEQVWVRSLREAAEDGHLTAAEAKAARENALLIARRNLGPEGLRKLAAVLGTDETGIVPWLASKLEEAVLRMKGAP
jgi:hypothetical protein